MVGESSKFSSFHDKIDCNGDTISSWAESVKAGTYRCKICHSSENAFKRGVYSFNQHAKGDQHKANMKNANKASKQLSIAASFKQAAAEDEHANVLKKKTRNFEIDLVRRLDRHFVSLEVLPCLVQCLKTHLNSEEGKQIVENMSLGADKGRYLSEHGIAKTYLEETILKLQTCDGFSVGFDESEVNKLTELQVMVILAEKSNGIELRHYRTLNLDGGDAESITAALVEQFDEDRIPWREKLIAPMTDGCPTMQGHQNGVKKKLADLAPQIQDFGSCNDHHLGNAARYGCKEIDVTEDYQTLPEVFIDLYYDLGAAPGKGNKRKKSFEKLARDKGRKIKSFHKYGATRFKGYCICIEPILFNWENLFDYYDNVEEPTPRQVKLRKFFVEKEFESLLKLQFIMAATRDLMAAIAYFEERENKIHLARAKMESILRSQFLKFLKKGFVENRDEEGNIEKKTGIELLNVKIDEEGNHLSRNLVFIGQKCEELIEKFGLTPTSPQLDEFYSTVFKFHHKVAEMLVKYFRIGLTSTELEYMEGFSPLNRTNEDTPQQIQFLAGSFSKILKAIRPMDCFDKLKSEVEAYQIDPEIAKLPKTLSYNNFWLEVGNIKEGKWNVYEILPRFALVLGTPFNSGAEMERGFSVQSNIHKDPKRNRMRHETLDSHMQIRFRVECKENQEKCEKCKDGGKCLCHCKFAEISDTMRRNCSQAWRKDGR